MTNLIAEFTRVSGIRVELDCQPIPKMKDLQLADPALDLKDVAPPTLKTLALSAYNEAILLEEQQTQNSHLSALFTI